MSDVGPAQNVKRSSEIKGLRLSWLPESSGRRSRTSGQASGAWKLASARSSTRAKANPPCSVNSLWRNSSMMKLKLPVWNDFCALGVAANRSASARALAAA